MKNKLLPVILSVFLATAVTACGSPDAGSEGADGQNAGGDTAGSQNAGGNTAGSQNAGNGSAGAQAGKVKLSFIHPHLDANVGKYAEETAIIQMTEKFKEDHPEVELDETRMSGEDYSTKILALAAADDLPDVFQASGSWLENMTANGQVAPLNEVLETRPDFYHGFRQGTFDRSTFDGTIYGVPQASGPTHIIFYNSELFGKAGYPEFPKTLDGLMDACEKIKAMGLTPFSMGNSNPWYALSSWFDVVGDRYTGGEWFDSVLSGGGAKFTDPEFVNALSAFRSMAEKGYFNRDANSVDDTTMAGYYFDGSAAAFANGIWSVDYIVKNAPPELLAVTKPAFFPTVEGGKGKPGISSAGAGVYFVINSKLADDPEKMEAAMSLIEYTVGKDSAKIMAQMGGFPAYDPQDFNTSGLDRLAAETYKLCSETEFCKIYDMWLPPEVTDTMASNVQAMIGLDKTAEEAAGAIQEEYENYLSFSAE